MKIKKRRNSSARLNGDESYSFEIDAFLFTFYQIYRNFHSPSFPSSLPFPKSWRICVPLFRLFEVMNSCMCRNILMSWGFCVFLFGLKPLRFHCWCSYQSHFQKVRRTEPTKKNDMFICGDFHHELPFKVYCNWLGLLFLVSVFAFVSLMWLSR